MPRYRRWAGGYIRKGVYWIDRTHRTGRRYRESTFCRTEEGALAALAAFERDPEAWVAEKLRKQQIAAPGSIGEYGRKFLDWSRDVEGNGDKHVYQQGAALDFFGRFLTSQSLPDTVDQLTVSNVEAFISWRKNGGTGRKAGPHAIALDVIAIKVFSWWLRAKAEALPWPDPLAPNPSNGQVGVSIPSRPKGSSRIKVITVDEWTKVREHLADWWRDAGDILFASSMRYSSLARLTPDDVDIREGVIRLPGKEVKDGEDNTLRVPERIAKIAKLLAMRGIPPTASQFDRRLGAACRRAGVERFTASTLRSTHASMMVDAGHSMKEVQAQLGHADLATTERYVERIKGRRSSWSGPIE